MKQFEEELNNILDNNLRSEQKKQLLYDTILKSVQRNFKEKEKSQ